jgi:hypothetical protein
MTTVLRPVGYTGSLQQLTWQFGNNVSVAAYLWGGGGGGGGNDSGIGGTGGGGAYSVVNFSISAGDVLQIAVGGPGGGGAGNRGSAPGGSPGFSYTQSQIFNTITAVPPGAPVFPQFNSRYCTFLNTNGVWVNPSSTTNFDKTYTVTFPSSTEYQFIGSADNYADIYVDGVLVLSATDYRTTFEARTFVSAGVHAVRIVAVNTGGPGAVALVINSGTSFSGGAGGAAGPSGSSGAGGGGGGATVVILNGTALGAAGGGGGGGGAGNVGVRNGQNAPGNRGQAAVGINAGQNGQPNSGDGGGGGGGGGGWGGGNGGITPGGDVGAYAGAFGLSSGTYQDPSGRTPGGTGSVYYPGTGIALGGVTATQGSGGYAIFDFNVSGVSVHHVESFAPVKNTWVNVNNAWQSVKSIYVKDGGVWNPVYGSISPTFSNVANQFGANPRPFG